VVLKLSAWGCGYLVKAFRDDAEILFQRAVTMQSKLEENAEEQLRGVLPLMLIKIKNFIVNSTSSSELCEFSRSSFLSTVICKSVYQPRSCY
jgi:hypothetical protein